MTFTEALQDLSESERNFLTGMLAARGKFYIGKTSRGRDRFGPSLSLELSDPMPERMAVLFGEPQVRTYYAHPVLRYVLQDTAKISALIGTLFYLAPDALRTKMDGMYGFCKAQSAEERIKMYENFIAS